ncbi:MAG TPA: sulfatase [Rubrobacteraceae bacterium]|nr:sulfatase [Rubrobacteraceae bacterium]
MDQGPRLMPSVRTYAAFVVLLAVLVVVGCGPSASEREAADAGGGVGSGEAASPGPSEKPNVIMILTDDLDAASISRMPNLRSLLVEEGTTFENAFVTDPLCCPSRATILRGQYAHNHEILGNEPPNGGFEKFRTLGRQNSTVATWLQDAGYRTVLVGKYMNGYDTTYVPPGWDEWYGIAGNYTSTDLNENGEIVSYDPESYHLDDVLAGKALDFVGDRGRGGAPTLFRPEKPFFMWLGTTAPHAPAEPATRHEEALADVSLPRPPSFDEGDVSDKPAWIADNPPLNPEQVARAEQLYLNRVRAMLAVDDMIGRLVRALEESGELENTYLIFTSDNGFHLGQHRLTSGKWTAYEEDIRVPLIVRGPGVPEGRSLDHLVLNNDLAPTFAELAGAETPEFVDGRSLAPLLGDDPPPMEEWRSAFLVEAMAEAADIPESVDVGAGEVIPLLTGDTQPSEDQRRASPLDEAPLDKAGRPGLEAVRTQDRLYVEYETGESELYYLEEDPYQLDNAYEDAGLDDLWRLEGWLSELRDCAGEDCRIAEDTGP